MDCSWSCNNSRSASSVMTLCDCRGSTENSLSNKHRNRRHCHHQNQISVALIISQHDNDSCWTSDTKTTALTSVPMANEKQCSTLSADANGLGQMGFEVWKCSCLITKGTWLMNKNLLYTDSYKQCSSAQLATETYIQKTCIDVDILPHNHSPQNGAPSIDTPPPHVPTTAPMPKAQFYQNLQSTNVNNGVSTQVDSLNQKLLILTNICWSYLKI